MLSAFEPGMYRLTESGRYHPRYLPGVITVVEVLKTTNFDRSLGLTMLRVIDNEGLHTSLLHTRDWERVE